MRLTTDNCRCIVHTLSPCVVGRHLALELYISYQENGVEHEKGKRHANSPIVFNVATEHCNKIASKNTAIIVCACIFLRISVTLRASEGVYVLWGTGPHKIMTVIPPLPELGPETRAERPHHTHSHIRYVEHSSSSSSSSGPTGAARAAATATQEPTRSACVSHRCTIDRCMYAFD